jgi:hypothetical protein
MGQTEEFGLRTPDRGDADPGIPDPGIPDPRDPDPGDLAWQADRQRPVTGDARVDAVLARLDELEGLPVTEHREVFEDVHRRLRDVLGELDTGQPRRAGDAADAAGRPGR